MRSALLDRIGTRAMDRTPEGVPLAAREQASRRNQTAASTADEDDLKRLGLNDEEADVLRELDLANVIRLARENPILIWVKTSLWPGFMCELGQSGAPSGRSRAYVRSRRA